MRIEDAIQQSQFRSPLQKTWINIIYTGNLLNHKSGQVLRKHDISLSQYNILRILRGGKGRAISLQDIKKRMLDHNPDVSRMIDRMLHNGWVGRCEDPENRRKVQVSLLDAGMKLLDHVDYDPDFQQLHQPKQSLSGAEMEQLNALLDRFRTCFGS